MNSSLNKSFFIAFISKELSVVWKNYTVQRRTEFFSPISLAEHCQMHISIHVDPLRDQVSVYRRQPSPVRATVLGTESFSFVFTHNL